MRLRIGNGFNAVPDFFCNGASIDLRDSGFGDDVVILHDLVADEFFGLIHCHVGGLGALLGKPRAHRGILDRSLQLVVEPGDDRRRRPARGQ